MRVLVIVAMLVGISATAVAQSDPAVGPCAGAGPIDSSVKATVVQKPDRQPRRQSELVVQDVKFHALSIQDQDRNLEGPFKWVVATGVVDTTGHVDPTTANILSSSSIMLSHAVCDGFVKLAFSPALQHGQKVRALFKERFVFQSGAPTQADIDNINNHGGDRH